jgi:hypothetical protein
MSQENVEVVRSILPGPDVDVVELFEDDAAWGRMLETIRPSFDRAFVSVLHIPGADPSTSPGLQGVRDAWLDWLAPWVSYRSEVEQMIDLGDRVVSVVHDSARLQLDAPEVRLRTAAVWTLRAGSITRADWYPGGYDEAMAFIK